MEVFAVEGLPEIRAGDDLAAMIDDRVALHPDDVVCVASTVVSKTEGRDFDLSAFPAGDRARTVAQRIGAVADEEKDPRFAQAVLEESEELLIESPFLLAVTRFGHVAPNAGVDRSNVPDADLLLLPEEPNESAAGIRSGLDVAVDGAGDGPAVIVTDTCGRPFRRGQRGVAIGWDGLAPIRDWRGETDRDGHELEVTVQAVVDELAAAANVVTGEGDGGTPVAVIRDFDFGDHGEGEELFRPAEEDFVREALRDWTFEGSESSDSTTGIDRDADDGGDVP